HRDSTTPQVKTRRERRHVRRDTCEKEFVDGLLEDSDRRTFVHAVFHRQAAPKHLAAVFLQKGVNERNPSANRLFVEPAVRAMGPRRVMEQLTKLLSSGSENEQGGAVSAAYWVRGDEGEQRYRDARQRFKDAMLRQFVDTDSTYVRQRIIPMLSLDENDYSYDASALIAEAMHIARNHPDDYIRHRVEIQLGSAGPFRALPA
ncbi:MULTISPECIES: hypothetical protein, partial [unclassified Sphingopyxis]|uniref:hypothetical protein n=1 Tax=unclassified Sphingopyxis TaxID=2614943 RepID=UPI000B1F9DEC